MGLRARLAYRRCVIIETIDCEYMLPRYACAYLLVHEGRAAFVENNTARAVPKMLEALARHGLDAQDVELCVITHVHLDHAGGSSALMKACPNATLIAHPRAAPHVIDPTKLVNSAEQVYGKARFEELYGVIEPIPAERVRTMEDGERLNLGDRSLEFLHTRGHANHHFVVHDPVEEVVFTGDAFGIVYPDLQTDRVFAFPSTSPTDFDGPLAREAVAKIVSSGAKTAYLTHFGRVDAIGEIAQQLNTCLEHSERLMMEAYESALPDEALQAQIAPALAAFFDARLDEAKVEKAARARLATDLELNAQGLAFAAAKKRRKARR